MTATLRAVRPNERAETTEPAPSAVRRIVPRGRLAELTADHDRACEAAAAPDVVTEMRADAQRLIARLGLDQSALADLLGYGRGQYVRGHMDAAADEAGALDDVPLARILHFPGSA